MNERIQETSIEAFERVLPKINDRQNQIINLLSDNKSRTDAMIGRELSLPINCITNRRGELVKKGCVEESHKGICLVTGGKATYWKITQCGKEVNNFRQREDVIYQIK